MNKKLLVISLSILAIIIILIINLIISPASFRGEKINKDAIDFELINVNNESIKLSDFKGKVIALTFVYSHCPDVCQVILLRLSQVAINLKEKGYEDFMIVAVSVDYKGDTFDSVKSFLNKYYKGPKDKIIWLLGKSYEDLKSIWKAYKVLVYTEYLNETITNGSHVTNGHRGHEGEYIVIHSVNVYLIDKKFKIRVMFGALPTWSEEDVEHDMEILLKE